MKTGVKKSKRYLELKGQLLKHESAITKLNEKIKKYSMERHKLTMARREIEKALQEWFPSPIQEGVSDHALLRYLQRVYGFNTEEMRREILANRVQDAVEGSSKIIKGNKSWGVISNGHVIVSIVPSKSL